MKIAKCVIIAMIIAFIIIVCVKHAFATTYFATYDYRTGNVVQSPDRPIYNINQPQYPMNCYVIGNMISCY